MVFKGDVSVFGISVNLLIGRFLIFNMLGEEHSQSLQKFKRLVILEIITMKTGFVTSSKIKSLETLHVYGISVVNIHCQPYCYEAFLLNCIYIYVRTYIGTHLQLQLVKQISVKSMQLFT